MVFQRTLHYDTSQFAFFFGEVIEWGGGTLAAGCPHHTRWAIRYIGAKFFATLGTLALHPNRPLVEDKDDYVAYKHHDWLGIIALLVWLILLHKGLLFVVINGYFLIFDVFVRLQSSSPLGLCISLDGESGESPATKRSVTTIYGRQFWAGTILVTEQAHCATEIRT